MRLGVHVSIAGGFAIHTEDGLEATVRAFDRILALAQLRLIHLNDSKSAFESRVDRHWHIGEGGIGLDGMRRIVTHPELRERPFILETPKKTAQTTGSPRVGAGEGEDRRNLNTVRRLLARDAAAADSNGR